MLLVPSLEAAYRASRWVGFSCTSDAPMPAAAAAAGAGADKGAAAAAGGDGPPERAAAAAAAATAGSAGAAASSAAAPPRAVRFVAWKRGDSQAAQAAAAGESGAGSSSSSGGGAQQLRVPLPIPYPLPPQRYQPGDEPWMRDKYYSGKAIAKDSRRMLSGTSLVHSSCTSRPLLPFVNPCVAPAGSLLANQGALLFG